MHRTIFRVLISFVLAASCTIVSPSVTVAAAGSSRAAVEDTEDALVRLTFYPSARAARAAADDLVDEIKITGIEGGAGEEKYVLATALQSDVRVTVDEQTDDDALLLRFTGGGLYEGGAIHFEDTLDEGESVLLRAYPKDPAGGRITAQKDNLYGEYRLCSAVHPELSGNRTLSSRVITGHDLDAKGRGPYYTDAASFKQFAMGPWICYDEEDGSVSAVLTYGGVFRLYTAAEKQSASFRGELFHLQTASWGAPDAISFSSFESHGLELPDTLFPDQDQLGDYLITAGQGWGVQYLELTQINNGFGALSYLIPDAEDQTTFTFYRSFGGNPTWKQQYKQLVRGAQLNRSGLFGEDPWFAYNSDEDAVYADDNDLAEWTLYDIDKDGSPELFLELGSAEASYHMLIYTTMGEDEVYPCALDGNFCIGSGHTSVCSVPEENGALLWYGHMGYAEMHRLSLNGTELSMEQLLEEDLSGDQEIEYTPPKQVVDNSEVLTMFEPGTLYPIDRYEDYSELIGQLPAGIARRASGEEPDFYQKLKDGELDVTLCPVLHYLNSSEDEISFEDLLEEGVIYDYVGKLRISDEFFTDLNGDGENEAVLYLKQIGYEFGICRVILSEQDGRIYAYTDMVNAETGVTEDGVFYNDEWQYVNHMRILFDKTQAFMFYVP